MIRILIADDHNIARAGLRHLLARDPDIQVTAEAADGEQALRLLRGGDIDLALMDINMPKRTGMEVLQDMQQEGISVPVLIVSMYPDEHALRALRAGAAGFLTKDCEADELLRAVHTIRRGQRYTNAELAQRLLLRLDNLPHETLSPREYQIFELLVSGKSLTHIGERLEISVKTVSTYRSRLLEKMHMQSNAELIQYAVQHQLLG